MSDFPPGAHDRYLANYHRSVQTVYCQNYDCPGSDGVTVDYEEEYGQGSIWPEECPECGGALDWDRPPEPEEEGVPKDSLAGPDLATPCQAPPSLAVPRRASPCLGHESYPDDPQEEWKGQGQ